MSDTKQKLINLVSDLETEGSIDYFYTFLTLKLYGKADCPVGHFSEVCEMWEQHIKPRQEKQEQAKAEQTPEQRARAAYRNNIMRKTYDIESVDILRYISVITDDIYKEWEKMREAAV